MQKENPDKVVSNTSNPYLVIKSARKKKEEMKEHYFQPTPRK